MVAESPTVIMTTGQHSHTRARTACLPAAAVQCYSVSVREDGRLDGRKQAL